MTTGYTFPILNSDGTITTVSGWLPEPMSQSGTGNLLAFGKNTQGSLGNLTNSNYSSPLIIGSDSSWSYVENGGESCGGIKTDGTLWSWGSNGFGVLGNGTLISYSSPIQIGSLTNWRQISLTVVHAMAIKTDGTLWSWGHGYYGNLGNGTNSNYSSPIQIGLLTNWKQVSCGNYHTIAIKTDGTLWTWGYDNPGNLYGVLGNGTSSSYSSPIQIGSLTNWSQVYASQNNISAIKTDGTLWTWGYGYYGQLGNGTSGNLSRYSSPIQVGALTNWKQTACNVVGTFAIKTDGTLWGFGEAFRIGVNYSGSTVNYTSPVQIGTDNNWKQVTCGFDHTLAVKTNGTLWGWGGDAYGALGRGTTDSFVISPVQIGSLNNWSNLGKCDMQSIAIAPFTNTTRAASIVDMEDMFVPKDQFLTAGLWAWGNGSQGELGNGTALKYSSPIQIGSLTNWKYIVAGGAGIKTDGTLWTWGSNSFGKLGNGTTINYSSPIQIGLLANWKQVDSGAGALHSVAIKTDGTLWTWGWNFYGNLGNGNTINYSSPIQIGLLTNWKQVSVVASYNTAAVKTDGTLWTFGYNGKGQLGNGTTINYSSPIQIGLLTNWKQVSCGIYHMVAIKTDGTLWAWGNNSWVAQAVPAGQLGNGTTINYSSPVQIGSLTNWKQVSTGAAHTVAVKTDGTLWAWGYNGVGQLGNGNFVSYSSPIQVGALTNWKQVSAGPDVNSPSQEFTAAIKTDGTLWTWGGTYDVNYTQSGNLGFPVSGSVNYSSPVQVGYLTSWKQVSTTQWSALAIQAPDYYYNQ